MREYVILGKDFRPLELGDYGDTPKNGVLLIGDKAQKFSYSQAKYAIKRTIKYVKEKGLDWEVDGMRIILLKEKPKEARK